MNTLMQWFSSPEWSCLVQALLHSLWQGGLIGLALMVYLKRPKVRQASARYRACLTALGLTVVSTFLTWNLLYHEATWVRSAPGGASPLAPPSQLAKPKTVGAALQAPETSPVRQPAAKATPAPSRAPTISWQIWAAWIWLLGATVTLWRLMTAVVTANQLRHDAQPINHPHLQQCLERLRQRFGLRRPIEVLVSQQLQSPVVLGIFWPVILFPAWMITGQPVGYWQAVLAHELAHIRRYDHWANLGQMVLESLFFFNPFVWLISRQTRLEREACCDAWAVAVTGEPLVYTEALMTVAKGWPSATIEPALALSMAERQPSHLLDRIKRLLAPTYQPLVKLRWFSLLVSLLLSLGLLALLYVSSREAVVLAAQILTPKERIEKMAEIQKQYVPAAELSPTGTITLTGTVRSEDGSPLPMNEMPYCVAATKKANITGLYSFRLHEGRFQSSLPAGTIGWCIHYPGYAPAFGGPFTPHASSNQLNIDVVLSKGFTARIRLQDTSGKPVSGAIVQVSFSNGIGISSHSEQLISDAQGWVALNQATEKAPATLNVTADGFQEDRRQDIWLTPSQPLLITLSSAKWVSGQIVSKMTRQPIAGATIKVTREQSHTHGNFHGRSYLLREAPVMAETDTNGKFILNRLSDHIVYDLLITAVDHAPDWLHQVTSQSAPLFKELRPELAVLGRIEGPLDSLKQLNQLPAITYYQPGAFVTQQSHDAFVESDNDEHHFAIHDLWPGPLRITAGEKIIELDVQHSITNLVIDLASVSPDFTPRTVVFRFNLKPGQPEPQGQLMVRALEHRPTPTYLMPQALNITRGEARIEVETPGKVRVEPYGLVGYCPVQKPAFKEWEIPVGEGEYEVRLDLEPAGAIYGEFSGPDGPAIRPYVVVEAPPPLDPMSFNISDLNNLIANAQRNKIYITPLPLGGVYRVVANRGNYYALSEAIRLDEKQPMKHLVLHLPEGKKVAGQVRLPSGAPATHIPIQFGYTSPFNSRYGGSAKFTDHEGRFEFTDINPSVPGKSHVQVTPDRDYQPVTQPVQFDRMMNVRLVPGLTLSGSVKEADTDAPIPHATVFANGPGGTAETSTDEQGNFRFTTLQPQEYFFYVDSASIGQPPRLTVTPRQKAPLTLRVRLHEGSHLKPMRTETSAANTSQTRDTLQTQYQNVQKANPASTNQTQDLYIPYRALLSTVPETENRSEYVNCGSVPRASLIKPSDNYRVHPKLGRFFVATDYTQDQPSVAVLSDELWQRTFQGQTQILGQQIRLDQKHYTVVGIYAKRTQLSRLTEIQLPDVLIPAATAIKSNEDILK